MSSKEQPISSAECNLLIIWAVGWIVFTTLAAAIAGPLESLLICMVCHPQRLVRDSNGQEEHFSPSEIITLSCYIVFWLYLTFTLMANVNVGIGFIVGTIFIPRKKKSLPVLQQTDPSTATAPETRESE